MNKQGYTGKVMADSSMCIVEWNWFGYEISIKKKKPTTNLKIVVLASAEIIWVWVKMLCFEKNLKIFLDKEKC